MMAMLFSEVGMCQTRAAGAIWHCQKARSVATALDPQHVRDAQNQQET
jgi:hypothetical protein